jgi:hypothetical protein
VLRKAPRFSSTPVLSTCAGASNASGGTSAVASVALTDRSRIQSGRWAISMLDILSKSALIHFSPETCSEQPTLRLTVALISPRRYNRLLGAPIFSQRKGRGMDQGSTVVTYLAIRHAIDIVGPRKRLILINTSTRR